MINYNKLTCQMPPYFSHWFIMSMLNHKYQIQTNKTQAKKDQNMYTQTNKTITPQQ
jgi:hypothetical protein